MSSKEQFLSLEDLETTSLLGVELRQRQRNGSDTSSYSRVASSDEELDTLPTLYIYQQEKFEPIVRSNLCAMSCFFFSLAGVVFLSIIAVQLGSNSLYFKVSKENEAQKPKLVEGVMGAACMYLGCAIVSGWFWYRNGSINNNISDHLAVD